MSCNVMSHLVRGGGGTREGRGAAVDGARVPQHQVARSGAEQGVRLLQTGAITRDFHVIIIICGISVHEFVVTVVAARNTAKTACFFSHICESDQTLDALHASQSPALIHMHPSAAGALTLQEL